MYRIASALVVILMIFPQTAAAYTPKVLKGQLHFRPGSIVKNLFDPLRLRQERRERWGIRKERGFGQEDLRQEAALSAEAMQALEDATQTIAPPPSEPVTEHPPRIEASRELDPETEQRIRYYARQGACPNGLPQNVALRCLEVLAQTPPLRMHPSQEYLLQRAKNPKQALREAQSIPPTLADRIKYVVPRPDRVDMQQIPTMRTLEEGGGWLRASGRWMRGR